MRKLYLVLVLTIALILAACASATPGDPATNEADQGVEGSEGTAGTIREVMGEVTLLTDESGLGEKPLLEWSAVEGAVEYSLVILDEDGQVYWAWRGEETQVPFGGGADDGQPGQNAYLYGTMSWTVVAFDTTQLPIAISDQGNLSP